MFTHFRWKGFRKAAPAGQRHYRMGKYAMPETVRFFEGQLSETIFKLDVSLSESSIKHIKCCKNCGRSLTVGIRSQVSGKRHSFSLVRESLYSPVFPKVGGLKSEFKVLNWAIANCPTFKTSLGFWRCGIGEIHGS